MSFIIPLVVAVIFFALGFLLGRGRTTKTEQVARLVSLQPRARKALNERTQKRKDRIMTVAHKQGRITNDDVEDMFCISDSTARKYLDDLEKEGKLTQHGETGRGVYYTPQK